MEVQHAQVWALEVLQLRDVVVGQHQTVKLLRLRSFLEDTRDTVGVQVQHHQVDERGEGSSLDCGDSVLGC